jgi:broad-specificity NMP kinase
MGPSRSSVRSQFPPSHRSLNSLTSTFRGYPLKKIQENNEAEIMSVVLEEAREAYAEEIVVTLNSEDTTDLESNVSRIVQWIEAWLKNPELDPGS